MCRYGTTSYFTNELFSLFSQTLPFGEFGERQLFRRETTEKKLVNIEPSSEASYFILEIIVALKNSSKNTRQITDHR